MANIATSRPSWSSALSRRWALAKRSSAAWSVPVTQRRCSHETPSKEAGTPYSARMRLASTSICSSPTTPTTGGEPSSGRNTCTTPSSASSSSAFLSFFASIGSSSRGRRRCSGAKEGTPWKLIPSPSVSVSPMRSVPWLAMPTTSPGHASSATARSLAKKNSGAFTGTCLPVRTCASRIPFSSRPEQMRRKATRSRWLGSMLACTLNTKPVSFSSPGSTARASAARGPGGGAMAASPSSRCSTPKSRSAEPKKTGVSVPWRKAARSNGG